MRRLRYATLLLVLLGLALAASAHAADAVVPGELKLDPPTLVCLGVRWSIEGDANRNATVAVSYREEDAPTWREALPLSYINPGNLTFSRRKTPKGMRDGWYVEKQGDVFFRKMPPAFAGSIFDLKPATTYEIRLKMTDPDGGGVEKTLKATTRAVPVDPKNPKLVRCKPENLQLAVKAARPGTIIEVGPGVFKGVLNLREKKGAPGNPIVIRGTKGGKTILEGTGGRQVIHADDSEYIHLERLVIRGPVKTCALECDGARGLVVRRCRFENLGPIAHGICNSNWDKPGSNFHIADNVFQGDRTWPKTFRDFKGDTVAVKICGRGHVVCYNFIRGWNTAVQGNENTRRVYLLDTFDIYNNEIKVCLASTIEVDGGTHNIRVFRNRLTCCFFGVSTQPIYGGPVYFFRNVMYDLINTPYKLHNSPMGLLFFHNTTVRDGPAFYCQAGDAAHNILWRNNLHLGSATKDRMGMAGPRAWANYNPFINLDMDYDGFTEGKVSFRAEPMKKWKFFPTFTDWVRDNPLGLEKHSVVVDLSIFAKPIRFPGLAPTESDPQDLRLKAGSAAVDKGTPLANINDGYKGKAPDLGAYELGDALPHYGPRPE